MLKREIIIFGAAIIIAVLAVIYAVFCQSKRSRRLLLAFLVSACVCWLDFHWGPVLVAQFNTRHYPSTVGEILSQNVTHRFQGGRYSHENYNLDLSYRYTVNGRTFVGNRDRLIDGHGTFSDGNLSKWGRSVGSHIRVYYNPKNPKNAYLSVGLIPRDAITLFIFGSANILFLYLWYVAIRQPKDAELDD